MGPAANFGEQVLKESQTSCAPAQDAFSDLHPGGRLELQAAAGAKAFGPAAAQPAGAAADAGAAGGPATPRFRAAVVDLEPDAAVRAVRDCGVFIVPQVRVFEEHRARDASIC